MTAPCCNASRSRPRRSVRLAGGLLPALALVLMPKCPACVAAYVALFTGVGVSMSTAWYLRTSAITICVTSLLFLAASTLGRARLLPSRHHLRLSLTRQAAGGPALTRRSLG